jgi:hypothetical protein
MLEQRDSSVTMSARLPLVLIIFYIVFGGLFIANKNNRFNDIYFYGLSVFLWLIFMLHYFRKTKLSADLIKTVCQQFVNAKSLKYMYFAMYIILCFLIGLQFFIKDDILDRGLSVFIVYSMIMVLCSVIIQNHPYWLIAIAVILLICFIIQGVVGKWFWSKGQKIDESKNAFWSVWGLSILVFIGHKFTSCHVLSVVENAQSNKNFMVLFKMIMEILFCVLILEIVYVIYKYLSISENIDVSKFSNTKFIFTSIIFLCMIAAFLYSHNCINRNNNLFVIILVQIMCFLPLFVIWGKYMPMDEVGLVFGPIIFVICMVLFISMIVYKSMKCKGITNDFVIRLMDYLKMLVVWVLYIYITIMISVVNDPSLISDCNLEICYKNGSNMNKSTYNNNRCLHTKCKKCSQCEDNKFWAIDGELGGKNKEWFANNSSELRMDAESYRKNVVGYNGVYKCETKGGEKVDCDKYWEANS